MKRILASLAVIALLASPALAQTDGTTGTTGTDPNTGNTGTTGTTDRNEVDRTTGTAGERGVGTGSGEPMQYGDEPYNTGVAADGSLPATASSLPLIALIGIGSVMLGMLATRKGRNRR